MNDLVVKAIIVIAVIVASGGTYYYLTMPKELEGTITVSGAWALYPMMVKCAEEFQKLHPKVRIEISAGGAGKGMADALTGLVDLGMVSREIYQEEVERGAVWVAVVKDAVLVTVSELNPALSYILAKGVSRSTFMDIYIYGNVTTWGEIVGRPEITDAIHTYTRSDSCGAAETWAKYLGHKQEDLKGIGVYGDPGVADTVKNDRLGIGYNNLNYAYDANTSKPIEGLAIVPIDVNGNGVLDANESFYETRESVMNAIADGTYPSPPARELNLVTREEFTGLTSEFVRWILTDGQQYAPEAGYIPLTQERCAEQLGKLG